ncbi:MAG: GGDEF domain-containing protein, partial [Betaproteobacteria bacterium]|nr:GGDEF domain-containing protein [Betaproteobacteria bacterium]
MDPVTALTIATLMMLLNGGVLGLMHKSLSPDVQPSAADWRIGTLLLAGGSVLLAFQNALPAGFILPVGN